MGKKGFFTFDGSVAKEINCEVSDYVFDAATETYSFQNPRNMNFVVYFGTQTGTCPALEITKSEAA